MAVSDPTIAIAYLARGAEPQWERAFQRFLASYLSHPAGFPHRLYLLIKGFPSAWAQGRGEDIFSRVPHTKVILEDASLDVGAYRDWASQATEDFICPLNTFSEILGSNWLLNLVSNARRNGIGCVGATGSYESSRGLDPSIPQFPNAHLRSNAFLMRRELFVELTRTLVVSNKLQARLFESGERSLTRQIRQRGLDVLVVGRNGRGYSPLHWPQSDTFRQRTQANLLIADNQTRIYDALDWRAKAAVVGRTWGAYLNADRPIVARKLGNRAALPI
jgi:hypothetical protein